MLNLLPLAMNQRCQKSKAVDSRHRVVEIPASEQILVRTEMTYLKDILHPSDAYATDQVLLAITFLMGLTPIRISPIQKNGQRSVYISRVGCLISVCQMCFFMYCFLYSLVEDESIVGYFFKTDVSKAGDLMQKFIAMCGMMMMFIESLRKSHDLINLYHAIARSDRTFLNVGVEFSYRYIIKFRIVKLTFVSAVILAYVGSSFYMLFHNDIWPKYQAMVAFFSPLILLLVMVVLNISFIMRFTQYFDSLNGVSACACVYCSWPPSIHESHVIVW